MEIEKEKQSNRKIKEIDKERNLKKTRICNRNTTKENTSFQKSRVFGEAGSDVSF